MITHKDKLQNQIKKIQSLINDISESNLEEKLSIGGGVIIDLTCNSINTNSLLINGIDIYESFSDKVINTANITNSDTITTKNLTVSNKLTSNYDLTCYNIFSTNINNTNSINTNYLNFKILKTPYNYNVRPLHINFKIIYNGTASTRGYVMFIFNNALGFEYNGVVELFNCVGQIENSSSFTITDTYKCSVGIDINNLMKCEVHYADSTFTGYTVYNIKYIVGTLYTENSPSCIYQYATGYGDSNQLMRGNNLRFPTNHAVFCFKYMSISKN